MCFDIRTVSEYAESESQAQLYGALPEKRLSSALTGKIRVILPVRGG